MSETKTENDTSETNTVLNQDIELRRYQHAVPISSYIPSHHGIQDIIESTAPEAPVASPELIAINRLTEVTAYNANPRKVFVNIRAQDGEPTLSAPITSSFRINLREVLQAKPGYVWSVKTTSLSIPYSFYQINQYNSVLLITETTFFGYSRLLTLPFGNYSPTSLLNRINDFINTQFPTAVANLSFDPDLLRTKLDITGPAATWIFEFGSSQTNMQYVLGEDANYFYSSGTISYFSRPMDLVPIDHITVRCDLVNNNSYQTSTQGISNTIAHLDVPSFDAVSNPQLIGNPMEFEEHPVDNSSIASFLIEVYDGYERLVDLRGLDWNMTLMFTQKIDYLGSESADSLSKDLERMRINQLRDKMQSI